MIKLPAGHPENLEGDHSFLEWVQDASLQEPPQELSRSETGMRLEAALKLVATRVEEYRLALEHAAGSEHLAARLALNVKASIRRNSPALAVILGLARPAGDSVDAETAFLSDLAQRGVQVHTDEGRTALARFRAGLS